jgi:hypothetical protein
MKKTRIFWLIVIVIGLEIQRTASASQGSSSTCWEHQSVGGQMDRRASLCPAVKTNI